jgi:hypothetical protein
MPFMSQENNFREENRAEEIPAVENQLPGPNINEGLSADDKEALALLYKLIDGITRSRNTHPSGLDSE